MIDYIVKIFDRFFDKIKKKKIRIENLCPIHYSAYNSE